MLAAMPIVNQQRIVVSNAAMAQEYNNYDDNKYSQYPTEVNKYECRKVHLKDFL